MPGRRAGARGVRNGDAARVQRAKGADVMRRPAHSRNSPSPNIPGEGKHRRAMALLMVVTVLGVVAIVGFALLSAASLQAQAASNSTRSAEAASLAESGMELACYYLLYPSKAPVAIPVGSYWAGATGIHFGNT